MDIRAVRFMLAALVMALGPRMLLGVIPPGRSAGARYGLGKMSSVHPQRVPRKAVVGKARMPPTAFVREAGQ